MKNNFRYSFTDLFAKKVDLDKDKQVVISSIVIPQIQRPYAQGRTDKVCTYIRDKFLEEIFDNLKNDNAGIFDLNFIYGVIKPYNDEYRLELLDGQQRLTTLFLLYWYIANAELDDDEGKKVRDCLSRFLYETRTTSTVFCQELSSYKIKLEGKSPKEVIRNSKWYFKSFDRDSTICSMLTMLDAIHEKYVKLGKNDMFGRLDRLQFYVKSLGVYNLSEELYIKMNARGLQLSSFENFKADLTNYVSNSKFEPFGKKVPLYKKDDTAEQVLFNFNFAVKLDAKWVDIFWKDEADDFDEAYMSFFTRFFACKYIIASEEKVSDEAIRDDDDIKFFYTDAEERIDRKEYFDFKKFEKLLNEHPEYIVTLDKVLDVIYEYDNKDSKRNIYENMLPVWDKTTEKEGDDFYCNTSSKISHVKLVALSAVIEYFEAMEGFDVSTFQRWMRVVWNVIENTNIDGLAPVSSLVRKFSSVIHFVANRIKGGKAFYEALSKWNNSTTRENRALLEEIEKAKRISEDSRWEDTWMDVEKHPYFKGMATFFYKPGMSREEYAKNAAIAKGMFDSKGIIKGYRDKHVLIRAIISQFNTWGEIDRQYITERAENNKYLKNILASNEKVRAMLVDVTGKGTIEAAKAALQRHIANADEPQVWPNADEDEKLGFEMAIKRLRQDTKMYDWIYYEERFNSGRFRVSWYRGHIMLAVPNAKRAKIALDTERAKMANALCKDYGFIFSDKEEKEMFEKYRDCYGSSFWIYKKEESNCCVWVGFDLYHQLRIQVECNTEAYAKKLLSVFKEASYVEKNTTSIQFPILKHSSKEKTYRPLKKKIEYILGKI